MIDISVVIPVYKSADWIEKCLKSLSRQTYNADLFEIVLVFNGPDDGAKDFASRFRKSKPSLNIKILTCDRANASAARNLGARHSEGRFITWIDADDWVSQEYLELLASYAEKAVVPLAQIVNVDSDGKHEILNTINADILSQKVSRVHSTEFVRALTFMTAKLIPRSWVLKVPFDERLRSGEDVVFYAALMVKYDFKLSLMPAAAGAIYFRRVTAASVSRGNTTWDFMVLQRADVISELSILRKSANSKMTAILERHMRSQSSFIRRYINDNPDEKTAVIDYLVSRRISGFPWPIIHPSPTRLVIAYNFAPYSDTGAVVMSKRIRSSGRPVDVISNDMSRAREKNSDNLVLSAPYVVWSRELKAPAYFSSETAIESFVTSGLATQKEWADRGRSYESIYSRSMWPASHFLAAAIKINNPEIEWIAEFSDPARINTTGNFRNILLYSESLKNIYLKQGPQIYDKILKSSPELFTWTEFLPYLFADQIVFTNINQKQIMLSYSPEILRAVIERKSIVSQQPTLPRTYYELASASLELDSREVSLGYFGEFYNTRGLGELLEALEMLSEDQLSRIRLWVYSADASKIEQNASQRVLKRISMRQKVNYFEFLGLLDNFDYLIVNDAFTRDHHVTNPYLPSKLSDYRGSRSKVWGMVEEGSVLSLEQLDQRSFIGDTAGVLKCLQSILIQNPK